jgi:hypothetical protein
LYKFETKEMKDILKKAKEEPEKWFVYIYLWLKKWFGICW